MQRDDPSFKKDRGKRNLLLCFSVFAGQDDTNLRSLPPSGRHYANRMFLCGFARPWVQREEVGQIQKKLPLSCVGWIRTYGRKKEGRQWKLRNCIRLLLALALFPGLIDNERLKAFSSVTPCLFHFSSFLYPTTRSPILPLKASARTWLGT